MKYKILMADGTIGLVIKVRALMAVGWTPVGGAQHDPKLAWYQTMVNQEKPAKGGLFKLNADDLKVAALGIASYHRDNNEKAALMHPEDSEERSRCFARSRACMHIYDEMKETL